MMSDDTSKKDQRDRSRVAGGEDYEVRYFAEKHGLAPEQVRGLIEKFGNDRDALEVAAQHMKDASSSTKH